MEPWETKVIALCILFVTTLLCGIIPIQFVRVLRSSGQGRVTRAKVEFILSILNCFAGGVFLGTTLLHMIPEVREDVSNMLQHYGLATDFAVSEFIIGCGFFLIMIIENVVIVLQHRQSKTNYKPLESSVSCDPVTSPQAEEDSQALIVQGNRLQRASYGAIVRSEGDMDVEHNAQPLCTEADRNSTDVKLVEELAAIKRPAYDTDKPDHHQIVAASKEMHRDADIHSRSSPQAEPRLVAEDSDCMHANHSSHQQHHHMAPEQLASVRSFLLLLALSLHTVFEGLAIGLQPSNQAVWNLFIAIIVHKSVIAFSMGIQFAESLKTYWRARLFALLFAIMSPIGVAIGIGVFAANSMGEASIALSAILQAIAAGTFLYVTFFEVLNKEIGQDHNLLKVLFIIFGFGSMVLLNLFNGEPKD